MGCERMSSKLIHAKDKGDPLVHMVWVSAPRASASGSEKGPPRSVGAEEVMDCKDRN